MTFEEQFPSFKGKEYPPSLGGMLALTLDIQEHCLDKARVKQIIEDIVSENWLRQQTCDKIIKRLGL
jgi:hypothetical protein